MKKDIGVLLVEHTHEAARALVQAIRRGGFEVNGRRIETPAALRVALNADHWDLVVCNLGHPDLDPRTALDIVREASPDLPFVVAADTVDDETVTTLLHSGADDYVVMSGGGDRMGNAVRSCLEEAERRRQQRLRDESYRTLVDHAPQGMLILSDGRVALANAAAAGLLGHNGDSLDGLRIATVLEAFRPRDRDKVKRCWTPAENQEETAEPIEAHVIRSEEGTSWVEISSRTTVVAGVPAVHSTVVDISARRERQREFEAIGTLATALRWVGSRPEMVQLLLDQTLDLLGADAAALAMRDALSGDVVIERANGVWAGTVSGRLGDSSSLTRQVVKSGNAFVGSVGGDDGLSWPEVAASTRYLAGAPMIAEGIVIGVLWTGRNTEFEDDDVRVLNSIADTAASALRRMTLHGEAKLRLERLHALRSVDLAVHTSGDVDRIFEVILDQVLHQLRVDAASILRYDIVSDGLEQGPVRTAGDAPRPLGTTADEPAGLALRVARERRIIETTAIAAAMDASNRDRALAEAGYVTFIGVPLVADDELRGVLELLHREALATDEDRRGFLEAVAWQAAKAIDRARMVEELRLANAELMDAYDTTLEGWSQALELRDGEPAGHTRRVTDLAVDLARALEIDESDIVHVRRGALLHDVGKMAIPDSILLKAGPLDNDEWEVMRRHPQHAADLLSQIPHLWPALDIPYSHHERWDGSGYPDGLKGEDIPLAARLFAVIDVWDALRTTRPYREPLDDQEAVTYLEQNAGRLFDSHVIEVFLDMVRFSPSLPRE